MPKCYSQIQRFLATLQPGDLFSTIQFVHYCGESHSRTNIDQTLSRMVKNGYLDRIAHGIYVIAITRKQSYSCKEVALLKHQASLIRLQNLIPGEVLNIPQNLEKAYDTEKQTLLTTGSSSRFRFEGDYISIKQTSRRKIFLARTKVGTAALRLWEKGQHFCTGADVLKATAEFNRTELEEFVSLAPCMPAWLRSLAKTSTGPLWHKIAFMLKTKAKQNQQSEKIVIS